MVEEVDLDDSFGSCTLTELVVYDADFVFNIGQDYWHFSEQGGALNCLAKEVVEISLGAVLSCYVHIGVFEDIVREAALSDRNRALEGSEVDDKATEENKGDPIQRNSMAVLLRSRDVEGIEVSERATPDFNRRTSCA